MLAFFSHQRDHPFVIPEFLNRLRAGGVFIATVNGKDWEEIDWAELLEERQGQHNFCLDGVDDIPYLEKQEINGKLITIRP